MFRNYLKEIGIAHSAFVRSAPTKLILKIHQDVLALSNAFSARTDVYFFSQLLQIILAYEDIFNDLEGARVEGGLLN